MRLKSILSKHSGRGANGKVSVRHQGGRHKRFLRHIDFSRDKREVFGVVESIEYDPNRTAQIAAILYTDGDRRYILAPLGLAVGSKIVASPVAPIAPGNAMPLSRLPIGTQVHNVEMRLGKGGQIARGAGTAAIVQAREGGMVTLKLPSGEIRRIEGACFATVGQVGRIEHKTETIGKAGRSRHMGIRPTVRGVAMHPAAHPHGGGEGRSGEGMPPKTPWGKPARGVKTRKRKKYSNYLIVSRKKIGYGSKI